uniref:hypothetical protein n=1 Tax=Novipirellula sp. TaxID=2795430 RepID=UPI003563D92C
MQAMLHQMVAMVRCMATESDGFVEPEARHPTAVEYEYEYEYEIRSRCPPIVAGVINRLLLGRASAGILEVCGNDSIGELSAAQAHCKNQSMVPSGSGIRFGLLA